MEGLQDPVDERGVAVSPSDIHTTLKQKGICTRNQGSVSLHAVHALPNYRDKIANLEERLLFFWYSTEVDQGKWRDNKESTDIKGNPYSGTSHALVLILHGGVL